MLWFQNGCFMHQKASDFTSGETAWVSGGSGLFDRERWLELGGFDERFAPAYWEDIDLSYRAKQKGWQVLFESKAIVFHKHESTHKQVFSSKDMENISWQHAAYFVRKHGNVWQRLLTYFGNHTGFWNVSNHETTNSAHTLGYYYCRFIFLDFGNWEWFQLGQTGMKLLSPITAGLFGKHAEMSGFARLPLSFRSFGDYKAPFAIYANGFLPRYLVLNFGRFVCRSHSVVAWALWFL